MTPRGISELSRVDVAGARARLAATMGWLRRAQDAAAGGGVAASWTRLKGWSAPYPETTGYIVPTFFNHAALAGSAEDERRAFRMADWLLGLQLDSGAFAGGTALARPEPSVFNTGQILFGLIRAYAESEEERYIEAAARAGRWLASVQDSDGSWPRYDYRGRTHVYNTRTAWALLLAARSSGLADLERAAARNLSWAAAQVAPDGFFRGCAFDASLRDASVSRRVGIWLKERTAPRFFYSSSLHTIAYAIRGMLESAWILEDDDLRHLALRAVDRLAGEVRHGRLVGWYDEGWRPRSSSQCLTGLAQLAIIWLKLTIRREGSYQSEALLALDVVALSQDRNRAHAMEGGVAGSSPEYGLYLPFRFPNWAAKFAADAYMLVLACSGEASPSAEQVW